MPIDDAAPAADMNAALRVFRTAQWAHFVVVPLAPLGRADLADWRGCARAAVGVAVATAALGYAYGINAIGDRRSDASREKNPLVGITDVPRTTGALVTASAGIAIAAALPLGRVGLVSAMLSILASTLYSVGPRAKARPVVGLVANTLIFIPLLGLCTPGTHPALASVALTFTGLLVQNQLVHELADADEDTRGGDLTTGRWLGRRGVRAACAIVAVVSAVGAWMLSPDSMTGIASAVTLLGGTLVTALVDEPHAARRTHRWAAGLGGAATYLVGFFA